MDNRKVFSGNLFALILLILYAFAPLILSPVFKASNMPVAMYLVLPQILLLILPTIIYFIITKRSVKDTLRLNKIGVKSIVIVIGIGFLAQPIAMFLSLITQFVFPNRISQVVSSLNSIPLIIRLGVIALTPAICEEVTMRGVVLAGYENVSIKKSAIMTGMFFGMLHLDGNQLLYAFAIGVIFAYLVRITNSIFASMICHFTINGSQVVISDLASKLMELSGQNIESVQQTGLSAMTTSQIINTVLVLLIIGIVCVGIIVMLMGKLAKLNGYNFKNEKSKELTERVFNWPVIASILLYLLVIFYELKEIYKW